MSSAITPGPTPQQNLSSGDIPREFWSIPAADLSARLRSGPQGLGGADARTRLQTYGPNLLQQHSRASTIKLLLGQFSSPIILLLIFSAILSFFLDDAIDGGLILGIVLASGLLGFWQEHGAADAVAKLLAVVQVKATCLRDGRPSDEPVEAVVPGDVVVLDAGDLIPADSVLLDSKELFVDEATLTGETFPVAKLPGVLPAATPLAQRTNSLFMGTHVVSGSANILVVRTGKATEFGQVAGRLQSAPPETEFEHGVRRFGYLLVEVTLLFVVGIFAINVYFARPVLDSFLFALALAVGLTPQLLPAIVSVNLAQGARRMAADRVIVKRLAAIENFGSMNVLCSDKTGTLTEGTVRLHAAIAPDGAASERALLFAYLNASFESGFTNPIDEAIRAGQHFDIGGYGKLDEVPYDFVRKRLSILVSTPASHLLVTKGSVADVLGVCTQAEAAAGTIQPIAALSDAIARQYADSSTQGYRTLAVAYRDMAAATHCSRQDEAGMTFVGLLLLEDPTKPDVAATIKRMRDLGVSLKVITGDNRLVAVAVCSRVGLPDARVLAGPELNAMSNEALVARVNSVDIFAEVEPNQKERVLLALRKAGNVVGYMGDGINDASALHAADVGISVDGGVDVAKEAADIVLLDKDLGVLLKGIEEGRRTFANTIKYVFITTSANFGNMFSMAGVSLFLPFLPLLPKQILLNNFLTDLPAISIATDNVDPEMLSRPRRWDLKFIRSFMIIFGLQSSIFDYLTFGSLIFILHANEAQFRTGWFIESAVSEILILLVIRTRRTFFQSRPGRALLAASLFVAAVCLALPYTPIADYLGFVPLPLPFLLLIAAILALYLLSAEMVKRLFYRLVEP